MQLLFLHALPLDGRMWGNSTATLTDPVSAPDLFGLGDSIESWAHAVLDDVGSDELIVVGCSVGGSCALEVAAAAPKQVAGIVLVGAKADVNPDPVLRDEALRVLETEGMAGAWLHYWLPLFSESTPPSIKEAAQTMAMEQDAGLVANGVRAFHNRRDLSTFAADWQRPLVGISGADDVSPHPSKLRKITTGQNRAFHLVPNCGHYVNLEQPATFDRLLAQAITDITGTR